MLVKLKLTDINTEGGTQPRSEIDFATVNEYREKILDGVIFPPVTVFYDGSNYWLADGFHRVTAYHNAEIEEIEVEVIQGTQRDAQWFSLGANKEHDAGGLKRKPDDKKRAIEKILLDEEWSTKSQVIIAEHVGVTQGYISRINSRLITSNKSSNRQTVEGKDGRTYRTANIGKHYQAPDVNEKLVVEDEENNESLINDNKSDYNKLTKSSKAIRYAESAIWQLELIDRNDPDREKGLSLVIDWIIKNK